MYSCICAHMHAYTQKYIATMKKTENNDKYVLQYIVLLLHTHTYQCMYACVYVCVYIHL